MIEVGQLRRWRREPPTDSHAPVFVVLEPQVLEPHAIPMPGTGWNEAGWWILTEGRQCWVYEGDIEDDSEVISEAG